MKAVIQVVTRASVSVDGEIISSIGNGLCVLIGIKREDDLEDMKYIVRKILNVKVFSDEHNNKWSKSVMDKRYEILCISQFTLYHTLKGNRLDFYKARPSEGAKLFYNNFLAELDGKFGAMMEVDIRNNGPVTLEIESPIKPRKSFEADNEQ
ncbi:D-tyrosyl-tRNA(Tyr) deacylase 1 [Melipona quadrifasciata]|uniref:D-aminoacyl-tRNA deacylase n=1 Tax=Melipona quadrifasciata TaxID=166423 RepID=A0A0N0BD09_9HYME|nr:D-tyrosyl-tRNA(Tyr) deacylase 1 [Melipona quadrifasciata]